MNTYAFEDIEIGLTESFNAVVTTEMMEVFRTISGDVNPLHCDEDYAKSYGYPGRVVYGMLTASFYSTLAGVYLPGEHSLLQSVESKFRTPVFIGDVLRIKGTVTEKHEVFKRITVKAEITNKEGKRVSSAIMQIGFSA